MFLQMARDFEILWQCYGSKSGFALVGNLEGARNIIFLLIAS